MKKPGTPNPADLDRPIVFGNRTAKDLSAEMLTKIRLLMWAARIDPKSEHALADLSWYLARRSIKGIRVSLRRGDHGTTLDLPSRGSSDRNKKHKRGRKRLIIDDFELVAAFDRLKSVKLRTVKSRANALAGKNGAYPLLTPKQIEARYSRINKRVRRSREYRLLRTIGLCAMHREAPCFSYTDLDDQDLPELPGLCRGPRDCEFRVEADATLDDLQSALDHNARLPNRLLHVSKATQHATNTIKKARELTQKALRKFAARARGAGNGTPD